MMKKNVFSLLMALALLMGAAQPALAADTAATMQLSSTQGTVKVTNASGRELSLRDNMRLYSGYQVETSAKSYAWINLDDAKLMKLDASSAVEIRKSGKKLELLLKSGSLYGDVSKPLESDETLDVRTSTAIVGIRGTKFSVAQASPARQGTRDAETAEQWTTRVQVYEGTVAVRTRQEAPAASNTPGAPETSPAMVTTTISAGTQLVVNPGAGESEVFAESPLAAVDISGSAAVELAADPATLDSLGIKLSPEAARELLERDQAGAQRKLEETKSAQTGLESAASPSIVWDGAAEAPSGGREDASSSDRDPDPAPDPETFYTITFDPSGGSWDNDVEQRAGKTGADGLLTAGNIPTDPARDGYIFDGWYTAASGGTKADLTAAFTADATLYAQWLSSTVQVDQELADNSQEAAQRKIQELLNKPACTKVTVELTEYTVSYEGSDTPVGTLYLKDTLTVPEGKELVMNCCFQVGSNDSYSDKAQEPDGRARAAGTITVNGTLTVNQGMSLCTGTDVGVSAITIGSTGTLTDNTSGGNQIIGNVNNGGMLRITNTAGDWQLSSGSPATTFTNSGTIENRGTIRNLACAFTNSGAINGGSISNSSTFTNESGGTLSIGTEFTNDGNGTFINMGTVETGIGCSSTNSGTIQLNAGSGFTSDGAFYNEGSIVMTGSFFRQTYDVFDNRASGNIQIGLSCQLELSAGSYSHANAGTITNEGTITITSPDRFSNTGVITNEASGVIENQSSGNLTNRTGGTITNDGTYYGDAVSNSGTINGANAEQVTNGNPQP